MQNDDNIGVEEVFRKSWDEMEEDLIGRFSFFMSDDDLHPSIPLFQEMRLHGYDEWFRVGQSMATLILSRSKKHGLRQGQSCIHFDLYVDAHLIVNASIAQKRYQLTLVEPKVTTELKILLELLMAQPID